MQQNIKAVILCFIILLHRLLSLVSTILEHGPNFQTEKCVAIQFAVFIEKRQLYWLHVSRTKISDRILASWTQDFRQIIQWVSRDRKCEFDIYLPWWYAIANNVSSISLERILRLPTAINSLLLAFAVVQLRITMAAACDVKTRSRFTCT